MDDPAPMVLVVDDDPAVRDALTNLMRSIGLNVRAFASAAEFLASPRPDAPCCLVLDVRLPEVSGLDLQAELRRAGDAIPIVFITAHADVRMTVLAMKGGAIEFLPKPFHEQELLDGIRQALQHSAAARGQRAELKILRRRSALLTVREREVMARLLTGMLNKQVAAELGITEITVKIHRRHIMEKMAASSLVDLARMEEKLRRDEASDDKTRS